MNEINWSELDAKARQALYSSYSPYSGQKVGAAVLAVDSEGVERIFAGCNVENGSYTSTICAEVNAVTNAVTVMGPNVKIRAFSVFGDREEWDKVRQFEPCGNCRSVIFEFATKDCLMAWSPQPVPFKDIFSFMA